MFLLFNLVFIKVIWWMNNLQELEGEIIWLPFFFFCKINYQQQMKSFPRCFLIDTKNFFSVFIIILLQHSKHYVLSACFKTQVFGCQISGFIVFMVQNGILIFTVFSKGFFGHLELHSVEYGCSTFLLYYNFLFIWNPII